MDIEESQFYDLSAKFKKIDRYVRLAPSDFQLETCKKLVSPNGQSSAVGFYDPTLQRVKKEE